MPHLQQLFLEGIRPEMGHVGNLARTMAQPPQMQKTYTIRNDVNLKKNTLKLVRDDAKKSLYHLEFAFDASTDCKIKVFYAATESVGADGVVTFSALKGTAGTHAVEQRGKGLNQTFRTRPEHALDVSTYSGAELSYADAQPPARPRFPIVVSPPKKALPTPTLPSLPALPALSLPKGGASAPVEGLPDPLLGLAAGGALGLVPAGALITLRGWLLAGKAGRE